MKTIAPIEQAMAIRRLQGEMASALAAADEAKQVVVSAQKREAGNRKRAAMLALEIQQMQAVSTEPIVSEHALLRWLERVQGIDMEALRKHILSGTTASSINFAINGEVMKEGHALVFRDRIVVTVK